MIWLRNFIEMYQHLELGYVLQTPRQRWTHNPDPYAVEPWQKNTLEIEASEPSEKRNYQTFYKTQEKTTNSIAFATQRVFSFNKPQQFRRKSLHRSTKQNNRERCNMPNSENQSMINHYNINGNFLPDSPVTEKRKFSNQFFLKCTKTKRERGMRVQRQIQSDAAVGISSLSQIKKRVNYDSKIPSTKQEPLFIKLSSAIEIGFQDQKCESPPKQRRKGKVLSLGFRKISVIRGLMKQKSLKVECFPFL